MVFRSLGVKRPKHDPEMAARVPPGQYLTRGWPVLHHGSVPAFDPTTWDFRVFGEIEHPLHLTWDEFRALPRVIVHADIHCVTRWSRLDNDWYGVSFREILERVRPTSNARYVTFHCDGDYTTSLPLTVVDDADVLLALGHDGETLTPDHGYPLRAVVPKRYAWKSAKWLRAVEFMTDDRLGFWEQFGYHNNADFWHEERFAE